MHPSYVRRIFEAAIFGGAGYVSGILRATIVDWLYRIARSRAGARAGAGGRTRARVKVSIKKEIEEKRKKLVKRDELDYRILSAKPDLVLYGS